MIVNWESVCKNMVTAILVITCVLGLGALWLWRVGLLG